MQKFIVSLIVSAGIVGGLVCGSAMALTIRRGDLNFTVTNTSAVTPVTTETAWTTTGYRISAGQNNTGTIYIGGSSTITAATASDYLNAGDTMTENVAGKEYYLSSVYVRGSAVNDTYTVKYDIP